MSYKCKCGETNPEKFYDHKNKFVLYVIIKMLLNEQDKEANMDKEELEKLINEGLSQREIATRLGKGTSTIRYWLKKYELKTTKNIKNKGGKSHYCYKCGEIDSSKFYGDKKQICGSCHNKDTLRRGQEKRDYTIKQLGGECIRCGYKDYSCSLDIHHLDPSIKDENFKSLRGWSIERIDREIKNCVLLCRNCHTAHHTGHFDI